MTRTSVAAGIAALILCAPAHAGGTPELDAMIGRHAAAHGIPAALVHRVVRAESGYNPLASNAGNHGLMQIRLQTAKGMGYRGGASGLLNAETNLTYACAYLAGAYRAARGNPSRAYALYRSGYHGKGVPARAKPVLVADAVAGDAPAAAPQEDLVSRLFGAR